MSNEGKAVTPETTILDIISTHRETERVFKRLDEKTGTCVCCQGLFMPLRDAADRFGFSVEEALADITTVISEKTE